MKDLEGKHIVITGANTGIGKATAEALAKRGASLLLACRSEEKTRPVIEEIKRTTGNDKIEFIALDLGDQESVKKCAAAINARKEPVHILINNAGFAGTRGLTKQGFELTFGVNHLGHFLLTMLLMDKLKASAPARVVNVSSKAHYRAKGFDWEALRKKTATTTGVPEYGVSKLANVLFTRELAKRFEGSGVTFYSLHPGVIASDAWREIPWPIRPMIKVFMKDVHDGAKTQIWCATAPELGKESGRYYDECKEKVPSKLAQDDGLARELWERSEQWVGLS
jgi:retinol dehydrogenase 12